MISKIIFFILLLFLVPFFYLGFNKNFFEKNNTENSSYFKKNIQRLKSSCREVSIETENLDKKRKISNSLQKLTALMDKPIDLIFTDIEGHVIDFYCLKGKKIILVNFWASWCPPCIQEIPSLSELAEKYNEDIFVVAISTESQKRVKSFISQSFPNLSPHLKVAQINKIRAGMYFPEDKLPTTYIFNKEGLLKWKELGAKDWSDQQLAQQILQLAKDIDRKENNK